MVRAEQGRLLHRTDSGSSWHVGRRWGRLSVGWMEGIALLWPARQLCSLPATQSAGWATVAVPGPLHFGSDIPESSGSSWHSAGHVSASPHLPSLPAMSPPPAFSPDGHMGCCITRTPSLSSMRQKLVPNYECCIFIFIGAVSMIYSNLSQCHLGKICK